MYDKGAIYSLHSSDMKDVTTERAFFLLFPRAFTPVCSREVDELSANFEQLEGWDCYAGSTDSPEVMQEWRPEARIPLVTIKQQTDLLGQFVNEDSGYAQRIAVWVVNGEIVKTFREGSDQYRSWDKLRELTDSL